MTMVAACRRFVRVRDKAIKNDVVRVRDKATTKMMNEDSF
jgi:hypothetical protein